MNGFGACQKTSVETPVKTSLEILRLLTANPSMTLAEFAAEIGKANRVGGRGHSAESGQPKRGIHPAVFVNHAVGDGGARHCQLGLVCAPRCIVRAAGRGIAALVSGTGQALVPALLEKWQPILGVQASHWGVKKMKTKWGSCTPTAKRLWLNPELATRSVLCVEYIVVHELVHLIERRHSERFTALMDGFLPSWRICRETLNSEMLGHEVWSY